MQTVERAAGVLPSSLFGDVARMCLVCAVRRAVMIHRLVEGSYGSGTN